MGGNELRLSVLLAAVDKATGPFKRIMAGSKGVAGALRQSQAALRKLNETQRNMDGFSRMERELGGTSQALADARRKLASMSAQYNQAAEPSRKYTQQLKTQAAQVGKLIAQENKQRTALTGQRQALAAAGIDTNRLAIHQRELASKVDAANSQIAEQKSRLHKLSQASERAAKIHRGGMMASMHGAAAMYAGQRVLRAEMLPLDKAMAFESAMADVRKVVDFDTPGQFKQMSWDVEDLSRRLPMLPADIAAIVAAAGQASIPRKELLLFAEDAAKMGVAFDTTAEDAGQTMATWRTAFRMSQKDVVTLADKINYLGNTGPASVQKISDVVNRIGALGEVAGLQSGPLAALGATVAGMGIESEVSSTGIKNMLLTLASGSAATLRQRKSFKALGIDAEDMAKRLQEDAGGAILSVLEKLQRLPKAEQAATMTTLFGRESIGAIAPLLTNLDLLRTNFDKVTDAQKYAGSMQAEYASRVATSANSLQLLKNTGIVLAQSIGATLIPDFKVFAERAGTVVGRVVDWIRANPQLVQTIAKVVVGTTLLVTVLGALTMVLGIGAMAFSQIHKAVAILSGGKGLGSLLVSTMQLAGKALPWLMNGARLLLPVLGGISAPVLAIGAAVAIVAALVWKYWGPIKAFMQGVWQGISEAAAPVMAEIRTALAPLAPLWDMISGAMGKAWNWIKQLLGPFEATGAELQAATGYGKTFGEVLGKALGLVMWPLRLIARLVGWLAGLIVSNWGTIKTLFAWSPLGLITSNWGQISGFMTRLWDGIRLYVSGAWDFIAGIFTGNTGRILQGLQSMWAAVSGVLAGWPAKMMQAGVDMISGLITGIRSMLGSVGEAIGGVGAGVIGRFKSLLGIKSPSRVFAALGSYTMQGFTGGLLRAQQGPLRALDGIGGRVRQAGAGMALGALAAPAMAGGGHPPLTSPAATQEAAGATYQITIHAGGTATAPDIAREVRAAIEQFERERSARKNSRLTD